jgi:hypothetical protein
VTVAIEPRYWGDASLEQIHRMLGHEDQPVDDLYRVCQVLEAEATRLLDGARQHAASWAELLARSNDTALAHAYRKADEIRQRLELMAEFLADISAKVDLLTEQFVQVRVQVARMYQAVAEARPSHMLSWLVQAGAQRADAELVACTKKARRLMREYDENTCEVLSRWAEMITPMNGFGPASTLAEAFAASNEDTVPRQATLPGNSALQVGGNQVDPPTVPLSPTGSPSPSSDVGTRGEDTNEEWGRPRHSDRPRGIFDPDSDGVPQVLDGPIDDDGWLMQ